MDKRTCEYLKGDMTGALLAVANFILLYLVITKSAQVFSVITKNSRPRKRVTFLVAHTGSLVW
jgi:O-methyltransferase involved in polyketide biosynthesis